MPMHRAPSMEEEDLADSPNMNVNWVSSPGTWTFYIVSLVLARLFLAIVGISGPWGWTTLNLFHGLSTFLLMHWIKGSPDQASQGEYNSATFWEQLGDDGWTTTKRFCTLIPTVLCLVTLVVSDYAPAHMWLNVPCWLLCITPKLPMMNKVRLFGLNKTPGIDDNEKED